jgi:hypothetical protein
MFFGKLFKDSALGLAGPAPCGPEIQDDWDRGVENQFVKRRSFIENDNRN